MLFFEDFKCEDLIDYRAFGGLCSQAWICKKRQSFFYDINKHCSDCPTYIGFLDKLVKELNANGYLRSEGEKRA